jgi:hypothetical protein
MLGILAVWQAGQCQGFHQHLAVVVCVCVCCVCVLCAVSACLHVPPVQQVLGQVAPGLQQCLERLKQACVCCVCKVTAGKHTQVLLAHM